MLHAGGRLRGPEADSVSAQPDRPWAAAPESGWFSLETLPVRAVWSASDCSTRRASPSPPWAASAVARHCSAISIRLKAASCSSPPSQPPPLASRMERSIWATSRASNSTAAARMPSGVDLRSAESPASVHSNGNVGDAALMESEFEISIPSFRYSAAGTVLDTASTQIASRDMKEGRCPCLFKNRKPCIVFGDFPGFWHPPP